MSLKAVPSILASSLRDASHINSVWDINLCRRNSCNILGEENINIILTQFKSFYFTCPHKWKLGGVFVSPLTFDEVFLDSSTSQSVQGRSLTLQFGCNFCCVCICMCVCMCVCVCVCVCVVLIRWNSMYCTHYICLILSF